MKTIKKIFHGITLVLIITIFFISYPLAYALYGKKKIWLISETDFDARDNGFHFFKYLREHHKEINVIYLISNTNPNYKTIVDLGDSIEPHSYKHLLVFIAAKAKISTLVHGCSPSYLLTKYYLCKHHGTGKNISLKHGIFKNIHPNYFEKNAHLDLICCGAEPEYKFIDKNFKYSKKVAKYTGLARFDALHDVVLKKTILIMPTWRRWLDNLNDEIEFKKSGFFACWAALLTNKQFLEITKNNHFELCFYIHPKLNRFIKLFNSIDCDITFLDSKRGDNIQKYLKEASILITDFSSVFFDFAYMRKPVIYYQFDECEYYSSHYLKAYFDYRDNGFGPVCTDCASVIKKLQAICSNDLMMEKKYLSRSNDFFPLYDDKNCERIFDAIVEVIK